jgi:hypothetical protein
VIERCNGDLRGRSRSRTLTGDRVELPDMKILARQCSAGGCPTVYAAEEDDVIVQGYTETLDTPDGESAVRIPHHVLLEAAEQLQLSQQKNSRSPSS